MANASSGYLGVGVETTAGTAVPPTKYLPVKTVDFPTENGFIDVKEISGSRQSSKTYDGAVKPTVTLTTGFYPAGAMGVLLNAAIGSDTTTNVTGSTTSKLHTFNDALTLPSLSFERADSRGGGLILQRIGGCKIDSLAFKCQFGQDVDVTMSAQGLRFPDTTPTPIASPTYPTMNPFIFKGATVSIDSVASTVFKSINFDFKNMLEREDGLNGTRESTAMFEGGLDVTLAGTLIFKDLALYTKFSNTTFMNIQVQFVGDSLDPAGTPPTFYTSTFTFTKVKIQKFGIPFTAGAVINADVTFKVTYDTTVTPNRLFQATLQNADIGGTYTT